MIPKVNKPVKYLICRVLKTKAFEKLNKLRKDFIVKHSLAYFEHQR